MDDVKNPDLDLPREVLLVQQAEDVDKSKCIICQKTSKTLKTHSSEHGRNSIKRCTEIRNDEVTKRLKCVDDNFVYHNSNACYKGYTEKRKLPTNPENVIPNIEDIQEKGLS